MAQPSNDDATRVLKILIEDLVAGRLLYDLVEEVSIKTGVRQPDTAVVTRRHFVSILILTLCKVSEFYDHFKAVLPPEVQPRLRSINSSIKVRQLKVVRDKYIGHILDVRTHSPLQTADVEAVFDRAVASNLPEFLNWVHLPGNVAAENSVVGALEAAHAAISRAI